MEHSKCTLYCVSFIKIPKWKLFADEPVQVSGDNNRIIHGLARELYFRNLGNSAVARVHHGAGINGSCCGRGIAREDCYLLGSWGGRLGDHPDEHSRLSLLWQQLALT